MNLKCFALLRRESWLWRFALCSIQSFNSTILGFVPNRFWATLGLHVRKFKKSHRASINLASDLCWACTFLNSDCFYTTFCRCQCSSYARNRKTIGTYSNRNYVFQGVKGLTLVVNFHSPYCSSCTFRKPRAKERKEWRKHREKRWPSLLRFT